MSYVAMEAWEIRQLEEESYAEGYARAIEDAGRIASQHSPHGEPCEACHMAWRIRALAQPKRTQEGT